MTDPLSCEQRNVDDVDNEKHAVLTSQVVGSLEGGTKQTQSRLSLFK